MGYLLKKKLLHVSDKPSFDMLIRNQLKMRCLFDTGADTPVFILGDDALCKYFPDAQFEKKLTYILSGFGKGSECRILQSDRKINKKLSPHIQTDNPLKMEIPYVR